MPIETLIKYPAIFISGLLATVLLTPVWRRIAPKLGFIDQPGGRKIHRQPIPVAGGIAMFLGFHLACAAVFLAPWRPFAGQIEIEWWFRFIPLSLGVVTLGLWDDRFSLKPVIKLAGQTALALAAYALNIRIQNVLGLPMPEWVNLVGTVLWFLAIMNAFNLIDGIDGLAAGIALIAAIGIGISLVFRKSPGDVLLFLGFAGSCLGFLRYNYYPASVFLGDTGSLFIGFTLAALSISTSSKGTAVAAIGIPLLAVGVPLFDTILAIWRRSVRRLLSTAEDDVGIEKGDADHLHHRLLRQGRKHDQVAWLLYIATALLALTGILIAVFNDKILGILGLAFVVTAYVVFRHLAWIELRDTGEVILRGIARPVRRNLSLLFYMLADLSILNLAWLAAIRLGALHDGTDFVSLKALWMRAAPVDIVVPFLVLVGFRSYTRTWSLASIAEYATVGAAVVLGCVAAGALNLLRMPVRGVPLEMVSQYALMTGFAVCGVMSLRASFRVVQDLMHRRRAPDPKNGDPLRTLIFGHGTDLMLYLRHRAASHDSNRNLVLAGLVSNDDALCGHFISGFPVLGRITDIPALVVKKKIDLFYVVGSVDEEQMELFKNALRGTGIRMIHWRAVEREIDLCGAERNG